jgi:SAM-dependent methyltransferase
MNFVHRLLCSSDRWLQTVEQHIVPWTLENLDLGAQVLEIGPGYGPATRVLQKCVDHLTCVEIDRKLAVRLRTRIADPNVTVVNEDATSSSLPSSSFDSAVCFTMLHHLPSPALQDQLLREAFRLLRPGAVFAGTDSLTSRVFRMLHVFDTLTPIDPGTFPARLRAAGFESVQVHVNPWAFRFRSRKPKTA